MVTHFDAVDPPDPYKFWILKIQDGVGCLLEKLKNCQLKQEFD